MNVGEWSPGRLVLSIVLWLIVFPLAIVSLLVIGRPDLGHAPAMRALGIVLWIGPACAMIAAWWRGRRRRAP